MSEEKVLTLRGKKAVWAPGGGTGPIDPKRLPDYYPYEGTAIANIIPSTAVTMRSQSGMQYGYAAVEGFTKAQLTAGQVYTVLLDDTPYELEMLEMEGQTVIGNLSIAIPNMEDNGVPFLMMFDNGMFMIYVSIEGDTHTVSLDGPCYTLRKLPRRFVETYVMNTEANSATAAQYFADVTEMLETGDYPILVIEFGNTGVRHMVANIVENMAEKRYDMLVMDGKRLANESVGIGVSFEVISLTENDIKRNHTNYKTSNINFPFAYSKFDKKPYVRASGKSDYGFEYTNDLVVLSSTEGSTKQFKITLDDSGTLSAVEVTE